MDNLKFPALAKLTPEKRKEVIDLAARMAVLNHIKKLVEKMRAEMRAETTIPDSSSSANPKQD